MVVQNDCTKLQFFFGKNKQLVCSYQLLLVFYEKKKKKTATFISTSLIFFIIIIIIFFIFNRLIVFINNIFLYNFILFDFTFC